MPFRRRPIRRRRRARPARKRTSFVKRVLTVINKQREMKVSRPLSTVSNLNVPGSITNANGALQPLMPLIAQGDGEFERIGNQVTLHKIRVNAYYRLATGTLTNQQTRCMIRHMVVRQRDCMNADSIINAVYPLAVNQILENATPYLGSIQNYNTPLNKAAFISRRQIKKVMTGPVYDPTTLLATGADNFNSYFMVTYTLTFGKGKKLHYGTGGATAPSNFGYFLMHCAAGLGSAFALPVGSVQYNMTTTAYYTDA